MGVSVFRPYLQKLCCYSPWNYAVLWSRMNQHENVLSWEDGFCNFQNPKISAVRKTDAFLFEESSEILASAFSSCMPSGSFCSYPIELAVAEMSSASHVIGNGPIGDVASTRQARWIYAGHAAADIANSDLFPDYPDEWLLQFAEGIKTILLLPVGLYGVLQLGSSEMLTEDTALPSRTEDMPAWFEESLLPDWRNVITELSLVFAFLESSPENEMEIGDHTTLRMSPMDDPYLLSAEARQEEMLMASLFSEGIDLGVFLNDFEDTDMNLVGGGVEQSICGIFNIPEESELRKELGLPAINPVLFAACNAEMKPLLEANGSSRVDDTLSCMSSVTFLNAPDTKQSVSGSGRDDFPVSNSVACFTPSVSPAGRMKEEQRKASHSSNQEGAKVSKFPRNHKRKERSDDAPDSKPRDRQLIQERMEELRTLVPDSSKCSIDGLLDKTINHMLFLKSVTDQADALKKHEADESKWRSPETENQKGGSRAVETGDADQQKRPIAVKDLKQPGHMLIEITCADHDQFLELTDAIHRLQLTVLKGVMDKSSGHSSARFIVKVSESFHRMDIFWPLMQLLQYNPATITARV